MKHRMTCYLAGLCLVLIPLTHSGWAAAPTPTPKITCANPDYDFGEKDNTEVVTHEYKIRNEGDGDLIISLVKASCGCTVAEISSKHLEPGQEAVITARFDLKGRRDRQSKHITVTSNDPVNPEFILRLTGIATSEIELTPSMLSFGNVLPGETVTKPIVLKATADGNFAIKEIKALASKVTWRLEEVEAGRHYIIHCTLPADLPVGRVSDRISITTDHPKLATLGVSITGNVMGKLVVSPDRIMLSENSDRPVTRYISVSGGSVQDFEILEATWPDAEVAVRTTKMPTYGYRVQLSNVLGRKDLDGKDLVLKTNVEGMEEIKIPIMVRPPYPSPGANHPPDTSDGPPGSEAHL